MNVIRPVRESDVDRLLELAELTSFGLTTLPRDRALLARRVKQSVRAFQHLDDDQPSGQSYLFVMEDLGRKLVVGTCGIASKIGGFEPFYAYRLETTIHESKMLNIRREIGVLHLVEEHDGPCEIGSLFLHPDFRGGGGGRVLSLSRFLFIAAHPQLFDAEVIAEMRGVIDNTGRTPFWDAVGRHFFNLEFPKADYLSMVNKEFIGDLMPRHPIYVPILPPEAQQVIGEVHELTRPALRLLKTEGFEFRNLVDIFEAGPVLHCKRDDIRAVRNSKLATVTAIVDGDPAGEEHLIASTTGGFRCMKGTLSAINNEVVLSALVAEGLGVVAGDLVRFVPLRTSEKETLR